MEKKTRIDKAKKLALYSLIFNTLYSAAQVVFGVVNHSWWIFVIGVYYALLSIVRFAVLCAKDRGVFVLRFTGIMLMALSLPLVGVVILSFVKDRGNVFHEIVMIAIALYTCIKVTLATTNLLEAKHIQSVKYKGLRNISFADALVSIFALQRSMLVSFQGMGEVEIQIMNVALGSAVCIFVFLLGFNLMKMKDKKNRIGE